MVVAATILLALVILYLVGRGVDRPRIVHIVRVGLAGGAIAAFTVGLPFASERPLETLAACSMLALLVSTAYYAREEILATVTPAGIVFLNVAANLAPAEGPMPLTFAWLASLIPLPYGPIRVMLNLLVLYAPALAALFLLRRGPPGNPHLRYALGVWVCWVGIAAIVGPGWDTVVEARIDDPSRWLATGLIAFAAWQVTMLALNILLSMSEEAGGGRSMARSVRVDGMKPWRASAFGLGFWAVAFLCMKLPLGDELKANALIAAAFGLASVLSRRPVEPEAETRDDEKVMKAAGLARFGLVLYYLALAGGAAYWLWFHHAPGYRSAMNTRINPATGAARPARAPASEGPTLPQGRSLRWEGTAHETAFRDWLTRKSVKSEIVKRGTGSYLVWEDGPHHQRLLEAFREGERTASLGIDFHLLHLLVCDPLPGFGGGTDAAFETAEHQRRFVDWLEKRGVKSRILSRDGREFVHWLSNDYGLLAEYVELRGRPVLVYRSRPVQASSLFIGNPCGA